MAHNVSTAREFTNARPAHEFAINVDEPVLTVADDRFATLPDHEVTFYRNPDENLVVNPWGSTGPNVTFTGEDLFALREFLTEFPEESFVRPADPVVKTRWTDGDEVLETNPSNGAWWRFRRIDGVWRSAKANGAIGGGAVLSDEHVTGYVDRTDQERRSTGGDFWVILTEQGADA